MKASELQARVETLEKLVAVLLRQTGHERAALTDLQHQAQDPQAKWMSDHWWNRTSEFGQAYEHERAELQRQKGEIFPE